MGLASLTSHVSLLEQKSQTGNHNSSFSKLHRKSEEVNHVKIMSLGEFTFATLSKKM